MTNLHPKAVFFLFFVFFFFSRQLQAKAATVYTVNKEIRTMEMKDLASCSSAVKGRLSNDCINFVPQNVCDLFSCSSNFNSDNTRYSNVGYLYVNKSRLSIQQLSCGIAWNLTYTNLGKKNFLDQNSPIFICSAWWWGWLRWGLKVDIKNFIT